VAAAVMRNNPHQSLASVVTGELKDEIKEAKEGSLLFPSLDYVTSHYSYFTAAAVDRISVKDKQNYDLRNGKRKSGDLPEEAPPSKRPKTNTDKPNEYTGVDETDNLYGGITDEDLLALELDFTKPRRESL